MNDRKVFWINISLVNLVAVALLGLTLRSKILFSLPFIDYKNVLNAHSHFAFAGWVGMALSTLMIYNLLPSEIAAKKIYHRILAATQISAMGMLLTFPFQGYSAIPIFFSTLVILVNYVFCWVFARDLYRSGNPWPVRLLGIGAVLCLALSSIGPFTLAYIMASHSGNSLLYRDSVYTFLHFQYNGFFTLSVFALIFRHLLQFGHIPAKAVRNFSVVLVASVIPSLFLSLLWHNSPVLYALASLGSFLLLVSLILLFPVLRAARKGGIFVHSLSRTLWWLAVFSFLLKMVMNMGTVFPRLGDAVYGDRPVIIGFLHLVFLAFVTLYILSRLVEEDFFTKNGRVIDYPFLVFTAGILMTEAFLMIQGLQILFQSNSQLYTWLVWGGSILLLAGAALIAWVRLKLHRQRKAPAVTGASL